MQRGRIASALAVAAMAIAILTACAGNSPKPSAADSTAKPTAATCWTVNYTDTLTHAVWPGGKAIDCDEPHQDYLYAVVKLIGYQRSTWRTSSTDPSVYDPIYTAAERLCAAQRTKLVINVPELGATSFFLPKVESWKSGARWVRCDYGQVAIGSSTYSPAFADLPASFNAYQDEVYENPEAYRYCLNEPGSTSRTGPFTQQLSYLADCTKSPQWSRVSFGKLSGPTYPSAKTVKARLDPGCGGKFDTAKLRAVIVLPTKAEWNDGAHYWTCWRTTRATT